MMMGRDSRPPHPPRAELQAGLAGLPFDLEAGSVAYYEDPTYYDAEFDPRRADVRFYQAQYLDTEGPVLELGIGSGRIAIPAVRAGAEVYGLDTAPKMLARAEEKRRALPSAAQERLTLTLGDMRTFTLERRFELISCPFNALQHLYRGEEVSACFERVLTHLAPGGLFIFDVLFPDLEYLLRSPLTRHPGVNFHHSTYDAVYNYSEQSAYDPIKQINQMWLHYERVDPPLTRAEAEAVLYASEEGAFVQLEEGAPARFTLQLTHRCFFPQELTSLLRCAGLEVLQILGDFEGGALTVDSESMIFLCRRAGGG
ncbi:MAG: class I SAM-dependent methyltransferase [Myxococcota bacterium]|nr:class I SAM-dependent methyltransferase [Myxococcota bacterium]